MPQREEEWSVAQPFDRVEVMRSALSAAAEVGKGKLVKVKTADRRLGPPAGIGSRRLDSAQPPPAKTAGEVAAAGQQQAVAAAGEPPPGDRRGQTGLGEY